MNSAISKPVVISLNIGDQLTSISCGHIVAEFVKFIAYQRLQIPYSYQWLKQMVNKRKISEDRSINESLVAERHFRVASTALENLDFIIKSLLQEIDSACIPSEVCISLGASPIASKEVYRLLLPATCHKPKCHSAAIASDQKIQLSVFRELVTSEKLSQMFMNQLPPTNVYVFIKKSSKPAETVLNHDHFTFTSGHRIPRSAKIAIIDLRGQNPGNITCCNDFQVFNDVVQADFVKLNIDDSSNDSDNYHEIESTDFVKWYQSIFVMKGFKDCVVNGSSVTNSWRDL